jgi:hypothetical protein
MFGNAKQHEQEGLTLERSKQQSVLGACGDADAPLGAAAQLRFINTRCAERKNNITNLEHDAGFNINRWKLVQICQNPGTYKVPQFRYMALASIQSKDAQVGRGWSDCYASNHTMFGN